MSYLNAPATKLLATNCACCGRALVDAVSVERAVGPDCAEMHLRPEAQGEPDWQTAVKLLSTIGADDDVDASDTPRATVNRLVHHIARGRRDLDIAHAEIIFQAIHALGFVSLAERIAKRFRMSVVELPAAEPTVTREEAIAKLRLEYARAREAFCYDNASRDEFNAAIRTVDPKTPEQFTNAALSVTCKCKRCLGTGYYVRGVINGRPDLGDSICFRCCGKGYQTWEDGANNRAYDRYRKAQAEATGRSVAKSA